MNLEDQLRSHLRRQDPPSGFAERVLEAIDPGATAAGRREPRWWLRPWTLRWVTAGLATALLLFFGVLQYRDYHRTRLQGEMAKQQLLLALHIASSKLNEAQRIVQESER